MDIQRAQRRKRSRNVDVDEAVAELDISKLIFNLGIIAARGTRADAKNKFEYIQDLIANNARVATLQGAQADLQKINYSPTGAIYSPTTIHAHRQAKAAQQLQKGARWSNFSKILAAASKLQARSNY